MKAQHDPEQQAAAAKVLAFSGRFWPTDLPRPWETVPEWCRRIDGYANAPGCTPSAVHARAGGVAS